MVKLETRLINNILHEVDLPTVISKFVKLKPTGSDYKALCPFHTEKTPSFSVSSDKQFYYCFGCGASGNAITFLREYNGNGFVSALNYLVSNYVFDKKLQTQFYSHLKKVQNTSALDNQQKSSIGIGLSYIEEESIVSDENIYDFFAYLHNEFVKSLSKNSNAKSYLESRLTTNDIEKYQIGYCPNSELYLLDYLNSGENIQTQKKIIGNSGLIYAQKTRESVLLKNRIVFPIKNIKGNVIGFTGRTLGSSKTKYLNLGKSQVFDKSSSFYGLDKLTNGTTKVNLVEGPFDVIAMDQQRPKQVNLGLIGTSFTHLHAQFLKEIGVKKINSITDGDTAGEKSSKKIKYIVNTKGLDFSLELMPKGMDPYDLYYKNGNSRNFKENF